MHFMACERVQLLDWDDMRAPRMSVRAFASRCNQYQTDAFVHRSFRAWLRAGCPISYFGDDTSREIIIRSQYTIRIRDISFFFFLWKE